MTAITVPLSEERLEELNRLAEGLGVTPEDLAREGIETMIRVRRERFRQTADFLLEKNRELYRRLAR